MCKVKLASFEFEHVLEFEDVNTRTIKKKRVIGKCEPTVEERHYNSTPKEITLVARVNSAEKEELWDLFRECAWHPLYDRDCALIDYTWMERVRFRWDNSLGCGLRQWMVILGLVCEEI